MTRKTAPPEFLGALDALPALASLQEAVRRSGRPAYLVGGLLRDAALGRAPEGVLDVDLAVPSHASRLASELAKSLGGTAFPLDEETRIYRIALPSMQIDVAEIQGKDIEADLGRRDFTVNAMAAAFPLGSAPLIDPFGGLADLRRRRLRAVSPRAIKEDPLRLLRAFRLAARLGLKLEAGLLRSIRPQSRLIRRCAGERVRAELLALLAAPDSARWLKAMDDAGLLTAVFPELEPSRLCAVSYYGKGGVLRHSLTAVERLDFLLSKLEEVYPRFAPAVRAGLDAPLVRLAVLLHDVAKPPCAKRVGGRLRFFGHEARGAKMSEAILRRLRFSKEEIALVSAAVFHHLRPGNLAAGGVITDKAVFRFFRELQPHELSLLLLCWADHASYLSSGALAKVLGEVGRDPHQFDAAAHRSAAVRKTLYHLQVVSFLLDRNFNKPETVRPPKLIDGNAVMKALGLKPGPKVGEILRTLQEAQAEGRVKTRDEALAFIKKIDVK